MVRERLRQEAVEGPLLPRTESPAQNQTPARKASPVRRVSPSRKPNRNLNRRRKRNPSRILRAPAGRPKRKLLPAINLKACRLHGNGSLMQLQSALYRCWLSHFVSGIWLEIFPPSFINPHQHPVNLRRKIMQQHVSCRVNTQGRRDKKHNGSWPESSAPVKYPNRAKSPRAWCHATLAQ